MAPKRALNEQPKSDKKVLAIAAAAARLFSSKGYIETTMEDVAVAAKMSKGSMYYYFTSKSDILHFVLSNFLDLVLDNMQRDLEDVEDPIEKLRLMVFRHVKTYGEHMYLAKILLNEAHNLPSKQLKKIESKERKYFAAIAETISSCLGGGLKKDRLTVLTFNLLGMCNWIYAWYNPKGAITPEELSQAIFDTFTGSWKKK